MSSGEKAKPPATHEERNPFDISRRSGTEVAVEIAERMAAWKQARGRSYATPGTVPSGEAKQPPIAAPVQPARMPNLADDAAQPSQVQSPSQPVRERETDAPAAQRPPAASAAGSGKARASFLASFSVQRAMPPAPSLKPAARPSEPAPGRAPVAEMDERSATIPTTLPQADLSSPTTPPSKTESGAVAAQARDIELRRAKARDMKTRWIKAHDLDSPHIAVTPPAEMAEAKGAEPARSGIAAWDRAGVDVPGVPPAGSAIGVRDQASGHREPARDAPLAETRQVEGSGAAAPPVEDRDTGVPEADRRTLRTAAIPAVEALDEMLGRREPTFDEPIATRPADVAARSATGQRDIGTPRTGTSGIEPPAQQKPDIASRAPATKAFEQKASGRKEPTFDPPTGEKRKIKAAAPTPPAAEAADARRRLELRAIETRIEARRIDTLRADTLRADPQLAARRPIFPHIEPEEWDGPPAVAARAKRERGGTGWAIGLGAALLIAGITAPAAIWQQGQQGSPTDQDQVAMVNPLPPPEKSQPPAPATAQATPPAAPQPEAPPPPAQVRETAPPNRPAAQVQESSPVASLPAPEVKPDLGEATPQEQATLGAVREGGEVNEAPIVAPAPVDNLARETEPSAAPSVEPSVEFRQATVSPMVPRPFVPQRPAPFLRAPTTGNASIAVDGANPAGARLGAQAGAAGNASIAVDSVSPAGAQMGAQAGAQLGARAASIGPKPNLMVQLKPTAAEAPVVKAASSTPRKVRKPRPLIPQELDRMFETLIDTLSEGRQPPNPANKPASPSSRR